MRLDWGGRGFVVWSGLKGAVPVLLGSLLFDLGPGARERYAGIMARQGELLYRGTTATRFK